MVSYSFSNIYAVVLFQGMMLMGAMAAFSLILGCVSSAIIFQPNPDRTTVLVRGAVTKFHLNKKYLEAMNKLQSEVSSETHFSKFDLSEMVLYETSFITMNEE